MQFCSNSDPRIVLRRRRAIILSPRRSASFRKTSSLEIYPLPKRTIRRSSWRCRIKKCARTIIEAAARTALAERVNSANWSISWALQCSPAASRPPKLPTTRYFKNFSNLHKQTGSRQTLRRNRLPVRIACRSMHNAKSKLHCNTWANIWAGTDEFFPVPLPPTGKHPHGNCAPKGCWKMNRGVARQRQGTGRHDQSGMIPGMLAKALEHHRAGQLTEAEKIYRDILAIDARQADSLHLLGMIAYQAGSHEDAVTMIKSAIAINNRGASYHSNLGTVLQAQGKLKESAASYERALALKPDLAEVHTNLGNILRTLNKLDQAVACHERALALKPDLTEARYNLGLAQLQQGNFASGWANFERRWQTANFGTPMREYTQPLWTGGKLPSGRKKSKKKQYVQISSRTSRIIRRFW